MAGNYDYPETYPQGVNLYLNQIEKQMNCSGKGNLIRYI